MAFTRLSPAGAAPYALAAIALWATLASLGVALAHVPPFLLTGLALVIGSIPSWLYARQWKVPAGTLALGIGGLFGYHFLLFVALRTAPPVQANLVNYLWPLLIVVLAPWALPTLRPQATHLVAALAGFAGAALAVLGGQSVGAPFAWGYLAALASAFVWAGYSLLTRRVAPFPTAAIGLFGLVSGLLALLCHGLLESRTALSLRDLGFIAAIGLGPLGAAFFFWDAALKRGDPRNVALLSYLTPLASTLLLAWTTGRSLGAATLLAAALIVGSALIGLKAPATART